VDSDWVRAADCEDFQPVPGKQIHLPRKCLARGTIKTDVMEVTEISVDPLPVERFSLKNICSNPGTSIHELLDGDRRKQYVVEADGTLREIRRG